MFLVSSLCHFPLSAFSSSEFWFAGSELPGDNPGTGDRHMHALALQLKISPECFLFSVCSSELGSGKSPPGQRAPCAIPQIWSARSGCSATSSGTASSLQLNPSLLATSREPRPGTGMIPCAGHSVLQGSHVSQLRLRRGRGRHPFSVCSSAGPSLQAALPGTLHKPAPGATGFNPG